MYPQMFPHKRLLSAYYKRYERKFNGAIGEYFYLLLDQCVLDEF